ncbi:MAG: aldolase/citrate lyase family protein [Christensenella sp.]
MIFGQIETREALANCNDIITVEGVDGLFIGPSDLSVNLGIPGELSNPILLDAVAQVAAAGVSHKKATGIITSSMPLIASCKEKGMRLFSCGSETGMTIKRAKENVKEFKKLYS